MAKFPVEIFDDLNATELELFDIGTTIPDRIKTLKKVSSIRMGNSKVRELPDALFQMPKLRSLSIHFETLKSLPKTIAKAPMLRELDLSDTHALRELPASIGSTKLTVLRVNPGGLRSVPPALWNIKTLTRLELPPSVKKLPPGIAKLTKLHTLDLGIGALLSIASELPKLKKLRKLTIDLEREETPLPEEIGRLRLEELNLSSMKLTALPEVVLQIKSLESLGLYGMFALKTLADSVEKLPKLSFVNYQPKLLPASERKRIDAHIKLRAS